MNSSSDTKVLYLELNVSLEFTVYQQLGKVDPGLLRGIWFVVI